MLIRVNIEKSLGDFVQLYMYINIKYIVVIICSKVVENVLYYDHLHLYINRDFIGFAFFDLHLGTYRMRSNF